MAYLKYLLLAICILQITFFTVTCRRENGFCKILSVKQLIKHGSKHVYKNGIPKIIHYVYRSAYIPVQYSALVKQCMDINKDAEFVFWSDFTAYRFIITSFPEYLNIYKSYFNKSIDPLKISDVIRYFLLLKFGGIYMDLDTKCQKSFNTIFFNGSCILSRDIEEQTRILNNREYMAMNSFMACISNHLFFKYLVEKITIALDSWIVYQTGPIFLTDRFDEFTETMKPLNDKNPVNLADSYTFSPHSEPYLEIRCIRNAKGFWREKGCRDLANHRKLQKIKTKHAIVIHLFLHLGYNFRRNQIVMSDYLCSLVKGMNLVWC